MIAAESDAPQRFQRTEIPRHKTWGGPLVIPEHHRATPGNVECSKCGRHWKGKCPCTYYKRCTNWIDVIQNEYALKQWDRRLVAYGMSQRPDLVLAAAACKPPHDKKVLTQEDKDALQQIADQAKEFAKGSAAATIGTSLHKLTERMDLGETLGFVPAPWPADLKAYQEATKDIEWIDIESFRVHDEYKVGGTADRIGWYEGRLRIFDVKGLALTTLLPTPTGWTTMGAIQIGDQVFGSNGEPCTVTIKSDVKRIGTYIVSFNDGSKVTCDSEHIWWTTTRYDRDNGRGPQPRSILEVAATQRTNGGKGQNHHCVPVTQPLNLPELRLPIDPYLLGCWLGDGTCSNGGITKQDDLFDVLQSDGCVLGVRQIDKRSGCVTRTAVGLMALLRTWNLLNNKHIPDQYLRASDQQRLRLLQGLMDTDGTWNIPRRRAEFTTTDKAMAYQVEELLLTLGQQPHIDIVKRTGFGKTVIAYVLGFTPVDMMPFRLPRKAAKAVTGKQERKSDASARNRVIVSVEAGPDVETACIGIDSDDHTYLCSDRFIPTHNTGSDFWAGGQGPAMQLAMYARSRKYDIATDTRVPDVADLDLNVGYVIHLPEGQGFCELKPVDIMKGWGACRVAKEVWKTRDEKKYFMEPQQVRHTTTFVDLAAQAATVAELKTLWRSAAEQHALTPHVKKFITERAEALKSQARADLPVIRPQM